MPTPKLTDADLKQTAKLFYDNGKSIKKAPPQADLTTRHLVLGYEMPETGGISQIRQN